MPPVLTHLALHVADIEKTTAFYRDFCGMHVTRDRKDSKGGRVVWLSERGREREFILVVISGGSDHEATPSDFGHLGFALESRQAVDAIAERGRAAGILVWEPREEPYPVGYYCGLCDPAGQVVEFSYGQPLGPGAEGRSE